MKKIHYSVLVSFIVSFTSMLSAQERIAAFSYLDKGILTVSDPENTTLPFLNDKNDTTFYVVNESNAWIQFESETPIVLSAYTLVSSYNKSHDPASWTVNCSDDGVHWTILHTQALVFPERNYPLNVRTGVSGGGTAYRFYKFTFDNNGKPWSIAELQLFACDQTFERNLTSNGGVLTGEFPGLPSYGETLDKLIDNTYKKFCQTGTQSFWVQYESPEPVFLKGYSLTSAYNSPRMPRTWRLSGSNDGIRFNLLDYQKNKSFFDAPYSTQIYKISSQPQAPIDWALCADLVYNRLIEDYWRNYSKGGYYFAQRNGEEPHLGYNYWWMAHAFDILTDGYNRTGKADYLTKMEQMHQGILAYGNNSYWNTFYDDMEWMGLACLRAFEATGLNKYKTRAIDLWGWIKEGWTDVNYGGIMWASGSPNSKNACSNAPAIILAARLYQLTGEETYLTWAKKIYNWMNYYMVDHTTGYVWDGYNNFNVGNVYSYNMGTWIGGCLELYLITGEKKYLDHAILSADRVVNDLKKFSPFGVLYNGENGGDGGLFKCIFFRYLSQLIQRADLDEEKRHAYIDYFRDNGTVLWNAGTMKPEMIVSKKFYERPDGRQQDASVQICGVMIFELLDELKRKGFMPEKSEIIEENASHAYKYFLLEVLANNGDGASELGEWQLFGEAQSTVDHLKKEFPIHILTQRQRVVLSSDLGEFSYKIVHATGQLVARGNASKEASVFLPSSGLYIIQAQKGDIVFSQKIIVE